MSHQPVLNLAGTYRRQVNATLAQVWENVFDWEHLAHLHGTRFAECELIEAGPWGWRVALTSVGAPADQVIELRADREKNRYVAATIAGTGVGTEIRTLLFPRSDNQVDIAVEFHIPESRPERLQAVGDGYAAIYAQLWDEDEAMMIIRARTLAQRSKADYTAARLDIGEEHTVRARLPIFFELGGAPFRLVDLDGRLAAHSTICPHWQGPLDTAPVIGGAIRCPWHGYRFGVASGTCFEHPALKLAPAPDIRIAGGRIYAGWSRTAKVGEQVNPASE